MNKIKVEDILVKHLEGVSAKDSKAVYNHYKAAIKEIVEAVIDKCAEEAGYHPYNEDDRMAYINKDSILNVKKMIDYE